MKTNSNKSCSRDEFLRNVCKDSSKICKSQGSLFTESCERSRQDFIRSYLDGMLCPDNSYYFVGDGLYPSCGSPLSISDTLKVEDQGQVANGFEPVGSGETARDDALGNARISDHSMDSSYFDQSTSSVEDFRPLNLQLGELDSILNSKIPGCASKILFSSADMEDCSTLPALEEATNEPFHRVRGLRRDLWMNIDEYLQSNVLSNYSDVCNQANVDFGLNDSEEMDAADPISLVSDFLNLSYLEVNSLPASLFPEINQKRVTLVLDLDETLVHSTTKPCVDADFSFRIFISKEEKTIYVRRRPFLRAFLERVSELFDIILFTASQESYAKPLLDRLDPEEKFFSRYAFRDSCVLSEGIFTKDLKVLGVDLAKVAIVDNTPEVYRWQVNNGIPIKSWYNDPLDTELTSLLPFLETLVDVDDVRPIIEQKFNRKGQ